MKKILTLALVILGFSKGHSQSIEEILINRPGFDSVYEFIELKFPANTPVGKKAIIYTDGDFNVLGQVKKKIDLGTLNAGSNGLVLITANTNPYTVQAGTIVNAVLGNENGGNLENGSGTFLLVSYAGIGDLPNINDDLDGDNNGSLELLSSNITVLDCVGFLQKGASNVGDAVACATKNDTSKLDEPDGYILLSSVNGYGKVDQTTLGSFQMDATAIDPISFANRTFTPGFPNSTSTGILSNKVSNFGLKVFPNPNLGNGTISITSEKSVNATVNVFDLRGSLIANIFEGELNAGKSNFAFSLNLSKGIYMVSIQTGDEVVFNKFVVE
jgi:hypothetical protein